jgi:hypothetical protein
LTLETVSKASSIDIVRKWGALTCARVSVYKHRCIEMVGVHSQ